MSSGASQETSIPTSKLSEPKRKSKNLIVGAYIEPSIENAPKKMREKEFWDNFLIQTRNFVRFRNPKLPCK